VRNRKQINENEIFLKSLASSHRVWRAKTFGGRSGLGEPEKTVGTNVLVLSLQFSVDDVFSESGSGPAQPRHHVTQLLDRLHLCAGNLKKKSPGNSNKKARGNSNTKARETPINNLGNSNKKAQEIH
jgi:hypothetical protein